ncbi:MAG: hypothetical protein AAB359_03510 [Elusimicrobiota bacterium]
MGPAGSIYVNVGTMVHIQILNWKQGRKIVKVKQRRPIAVKKSFGISRQEAISLALGMLGFERITDSLSEPIDKLVQELVAAKKIIQIGEVLKAN